MSSVINSCEPVINSYETLLSIINSYETVSSVINSYVLNVCKILAFVTFTIFVIFSLSFDIK